MIKIVDIFDTVITELKANGRYNSQHDGDENWYESHIMLAELLNPNNAYEYTKKGIGWYYYTDSMGVTYGVRAVYQPIEPVPYFELKTWWENNDCSPVYDTPSHKSTAKDWDKRSNTVAKIYRDEIVPFLINNTYSNVLKIVPKDQQRYYFSKRLVEKFSPETWEIVENFPKELIINIK
jgi:hypothetical protein